jgi:MoaA/NifB/PqqE/SkfB family radical SAM enzyme
MIIFAPFTIQAVYSVHSMSSDIGVDFVKIFDKNIQLQGKSYCGVNIEAYSFYKDAKVVICSDKYSGEIKTHLLSLGYSEKNICEYDLNKNQEIQLSHKIDLPVLKKLNLSQYYFYWQREVNINLFLSEFNEKQRNDKIYFNALDLNITDVCTLRCNGCAALIHHFKHAKNVSFDEIKKGIDNAKRFIDYIDFLHVRGGEPLAHPELCDILLYIQKTNFARKYTIITNGTILPNPKVISVLKETGCKIDISNYNESSRHLNELVELAQKHNISCRVIDYSFWSRVREIAAEKHSEGAEKRKQCHPCINIKGPKFYICSFLAQEKELCHIPVDKTNSIDFTDPNCTREEFKEYLEGKIVPDGCSYCNGASQYQFDNDRIPVGVQLKEPAPYKIFKNES